MMISPIIFVRKVYRYRYLVIQMMKREISSRYRGSIFGFAWSVFTPLLMLVIYTFVFSVVFQARWGTGNVGESKIDFAITLFSGLIIFNLFSEIMNRAPNLILANVNFVKKVVFPLEILPIVSMGGVLFHSLVSLVVLLIAQILLNGSIPLTIIYLPLILLPLLLASLGVSWFLAAITVYIRDVSQITGIMTTVLLFLSAVFYPISSLPVEYQRILKLNPLAVIIEQARGIIIFGQTPDWLLLLIETIISFCFAIGGLWWFQKARKGFADVL